MYHCSVSSGLWDLVWWRPIGLCISRKSERASTQAVVALGAPVPRRLGGCLPWRPRSGRPDNWCISKSYIEAGRASASPWRMAAHGFHLSLVAFSFCKLCGIWCDFQTHLRKHHQCLPPPSEENPPVWVCGAESQQPSPMEHFGSSLKKLRS